ncbi:hypothetical protein DFJ73DRAFT_530903 [Zopfochytrium polystomum]|nr:hypothetical protein DFJ73DRAFT_530903 [Zopfochytrium polystomum]
MSSRSSKRRSRTATGNSSNHSASSLSSTASSPYPPPLAAAAAAAAITTTTTTTTTTVVDSDPAEDLFGAVAAADQVPNPYVLHTALYDHHHHRQPPSAAAAAAPAAAAAAANPHRTLSSASASSAVSATSPAQSFPTATHSPLFSPQPSPHSSPSRHLSDDHQHSLSPWWDPRSPSDSRVPEDPVLAPPALGFDAPTILGTLQTEPEAEDVVSDARGGDNDRDDEDDLPLGAAAALPLPSLSSTVDLSVSPADIIAVALATTVQDSPQPQTDEEEQQPIHEAPKRSQETPGMEAPLWLKVVELIESEADLLFLGSTCYALRSVVLDPGVVASWLFRKSTTYLALYNAYRNYPSLLTVPVVQHMRTLGAHLPRYLSVMAWEEEPDESSKSATAVRGGDQLHGLHGSTRCTAASWDSTPNRRPRRPPSTPGVSTAPRSSPQSHGSTTKRSAGSLDSTVAAATLKGRC